MEYQSILYYRERLNGPARTACDAVLRGWMSLEGDIPLPPGTYPVRTVTRTLRLDYPLIFHVNYYQNRYLRSSRGRRLQGNYFCSRDQSRELLALCEDWGRTVTAGLPPGLSLREKAARLQDCLADRVTYGDGGWEAHTVVGPIRDGRGVCEGIAKTYKFLCDLAGVPCILATGTAAGGRHAWNRLWLDGTAGFADVTAALSLPRGRRPLLLPREALERNGYAWEEAPGMEKGRQDG